MSDNENIGQPTALSFERDIRPLFRDLDRASMLKRFDLWNYDDVVNHGTAIASRLKAGTMPCDGAWQPEQVSTFDRWMQDGFAV